MIDMNQQIEDMRRQIISTEALLQKLRTSLQELTELQRRQAASNVFLDVVESSEGDTRRGIATGFDQRSNRWPLTQQEYRRYGRQLILPQIGAPRQVKLKDSRVLIIGVGGLGCPAATYLAGAGIGTLGLVDGDTVEESNLHRQIAHDTSRIGWNKAESGAAYLQRLNPLVKYDVHPQHLTSENAIPLFKQYDLILDCTDHPTSRYLISDACVITGRPLVSASALKTDGQLIVLNNPPQPAGDLTGGPCYRCLFAKPAPPETLVSCGEGGILGPVVGTMGILQALEAIKVLTSKKESTDLPASPRANLLMFSAYNEPQFRSIRMRSRRKDCASCSAKAFITEQRLTEGSLDYVAFCGVVSYDVLPQGARIAATEYAKVGKVDAVLLDVRDATQYEICHLDGSINIPWTGDATTWLKKAADMSNIDNAKDIYLVCRQGNDSQVAAAALQERNKTAKIMDIRGGFQAWHKDVDQTWPEY